MVRIPAADIKRLKNEVAVERLVEASEIELKKSGSKTSGSKKSFTAFGTYSVFALTILSIPQLIFPAIIHVRFPCLRR